MPTNSLLLLILLLSLVLLAVLFLSYRTYQRSRYYEQHFNLALLDPFQLDTYPTGAGQQPAASDDIKTVVFFGDSRALQWPFPDLPGHFEFINRGVDAQTSVLAAGRWSYHVAPLNPDYVVIQVGVNDLRLIAFYPEKQTAIIENSKANIEKIVADSVDNGATVVLTTIFPLGRAPIDQRFSGAASNVAEALKEVNSFLNSLASNKVIIMDTPSILAGESGQVRPEYSGDYLHINEAGYSALNQELAQLLQGSD